MTEESFEFKDGSSSKFWTISIEGHSFRVNFGKIGTSGQTQTKTFGSPSEAKVAYDKLVAEKLKKGYVRVSETAAPTIVAQSTISTYTEGPTLKHLRGRSTAVVEKPSKQNTAKTEKPDEMVPYSSVRSIGSNIKLLPEDYIWCSWLPRTVNLPKPEVVPFHRERALKELAAMGNDGSKWAAEAAKKFLSPLQMSPEEAEFWWQASDQFKQMPGSRVYFANRESSPECAEAKQKIIDYLRLANITGNVTTAEMDRLLLQMYDDEHWLDALIFLVCALCPAPYLAQYTATQKEEVAYLIMKKFRERVLPHLSEAELELVRSWLRRQLSTTKWLTKPPEHSVRSMYVSAAFLSMSTEVLQLVESLPDGIFAESRDNTPVPQVLVLALPSPEEILKHGERLGLRFYADSNYYSYMLNKETFIRPWLAATGLQGIPLLVKNIRDSSQDEAEKRLKLLASLMDVPELAPVCINLLDSHVSHTARTWLESHGDWSAPALLEVCTRRDKSGEAAKDILQTIYRSLSRESLDETCYERITAMFGSPEDSLPFLDESSMPGWLAEAFRTNKLPKAVFPDWVIPGSVPPLIVNKRKMTSAQMEQVIAALKKSSFEQVHPIVRSLRTNVDPRDMDKCLWWLFQKWLKAGAPPKEKWAMFSLGLLGSDETALRLAPLIKAWPGENQHARAVTGIECLRQIGTDTALMQVSGIAQSVSFKGLKQKAFECMQQIARERGLTKPELEDRIVPDCGLNERGERIFDFGPRQFSFVLTSDLKALVRDNDGNIKTELPKPGTSDDATKAETAIAEWKLMKQQIKEVAKVQVLRLEQAMVTRRQWCCSDFKKLLVQHPLMANLVRMLIWGSFDDEGLLIKSFRISEDRSFADENDKEIQLDDSEKIGIVHPLHLTPETRARWTELFSNYEIISPFPQLARQIFALEDPEKGQVTITRFEGKVVPAMTIVGTLEKLGWERGAVLDGRTFTEHLKYFAGADVTAIAEYEHILIGMISDSAPQDIKGCYFARGNVGSNGYPNNRAAIQLESIDPIILSEVLSDLTKVTAKARDK